MKRYCLALDLVNDPALISQYEDWHKSENMPAGIRKSILESGIVKMEIYRTGNRLFMIMETDDTFTMERKGAMDKANPEVEKWEQLMWKFQEPLPWGKQGEKWILMDQIFDLT